MSNNMFILERDHTLVSVYGRSVAFKKGEPTFVPPMCHAEAIAIGARPEKGEITAKMVGERVEEVVQKSAEGALTAEQEIMVLSAFDQLEERNLRADFSANGRPKVAVVRDLSSVQLSATQLNELWESRLELKDKLVEDKLVEDELVEDKLVEDDGQ